MNVFVLNEYGMEKYLVQDITTYYMGNKQELIISLDTLTEKGLSRKLNFNNLGLEDIPLSVTRELNLAGDVWKKSMCFIRGEGIGDTPIKTEFIIETNDYKKCLKPVIVKDMDVYTFPREKEPVRVGKYGKVLEETFELTYCLDKLPALDENYVKFLIDEIYWDEEKEHYVVFIVDSLTPNVRERFKLVPTNASGGILSDEEVNRLLALVDDGDDEEPKEVFVKHDANKRDYSLLPPKELGEIVDVLMHGAKTYGIGNWKKMDPKDTDRYVSALFRHLEAWRSGETKDPESGHSHLAHLACNCLFLMWFDNNKN